MPLPTTVETALEALALDPASLSGAERVELVTGVERVRNWIDAREAALLSVIHSERDDVNAGARDIAQLSQHKANVGFGEAKRRAARAIWLPELPGVHTAFETGSLGAAHVDDLCALAERLEPADRRKLVAVLPELLPELAGLTPIQARKRLAAFEDSLDTDDGEKRLARQRRANRFRQTRNPDRTSTLFGQLDPISAEILRNAIDARVLAMWRREGKGRDAHAAPTTITSNEQRRAAALIDLIQNGANTTASRGGADVLVLIDYQSILGQLGEKALATLGDGTPIPAAEARRLACDARIIPIIMGGPSQALDVGRAARTATGAQRSALRAIHDTCCISGCDVAFDYCELHHITWWRLGGRTDLDNLAPLCSKHHHLVHDHNWNLTLDHQRVGRLTHRTNTREPAPVPTPDRVPDRPACSPEVTPTPAPSRRPRRRSVKTDHRDSGGDTDRPAENTPPPEHLVPMRC